MEKQLPKLSGKEKIKFNIGQIIKLLGGGAIIVFMYISNGFDMSGTGEAIGYNIFTIAIMLIGVALIITAIRQWQD